MGQLTTNQLDTLINEVLADIPNAEKLRKKVAFAIMARHEMSCNPVSSDDWKAHKLTWDETFDKLNQVVLNKVKTVMEKRGDKLQL